MLARSPDRRLQILCEYRVLAIVPKDRKEHAPPTTDPRQWQAYVRQLAAADADCRGAVYQESPDNTQGDGGMEGFSSDGHGFQAYCPEEGKTAAEYKTALCTKITDDLAKLDRYKAFWAVTLRDRPLKYWRLVVPDKSFRNKDVVKHASERADAVRKLGLPFLVADFQAIVNTPADFPAALQRVSQGGQMLIADPPSHETKKALEAFEAEKADKIAALDTKLVALPRLDTPEKVVKFRRTLLIDNIRFENALSLLGERYPGAREQIIMKKEGLRSEIERQSALSEESPPARLNQARQEIENELEVAAPFVESTARRNMAWGVVAEWLFECPLYW